MRKIAAHPNKSSDTDKHDQHDLDARKHRRDLAGKTNRCAVERGENYDHHHGNKLKRRYLKRYAADVKTGQCLLEFVIEKIVKTDRKRHSRRRLRSRPGYEYLHPAV